MLSYGLGYLKTVAGTDAVLISPAAGYSDIAELRSATNVVDGDWYHIAFTHDMRAARLYIDGAFS